MWRVELHSHTIASRDCLVTPEQYLAACRRKGLDRAAVTDHNTAEGALRLHALAPELIIVGEEIRTTHGELLAYFLTETIPPDRPPLETIARIRAQGGIVAVSHPADRVRHEAMGLARLPVVLDHVDALETFNARCLLPEDNRRAAAVARERGLPGFCGSDAHTVYELGRATMRLAPFDGPAGFLASLRTGQPDARASVPFVHFASRWAKWMKRLGLAPAA
jgi:predicted metal-dependent phosphoesterase TrpH